MIIGKYELRKPWIKYVDMPIEEELYWGIRKSIGEDIAKEIESGMNNEGGWLASDHTVMNDREIAIWKLCASIARGQK